MSVTNIRSNPPEMAVFEPRIGVVLGMCQPSKIVLLVGLRVVSTAISRSSTVIRCTFRLWDDPSVANLEYKQDPIVSYHIITLRLVSEHSPDADDVMAGRLPMEA